MALTIKDIVERYEAFEPIVIADECGRYIYDGKVGDIPECLYQRTIKVRGWLMATCKRFIELEKETTDERIAELERRVADLEKQVKSQPSEIVKGLTDATEKACERMIAESKS
jgi:hypothetical protein